MCNAIVYPPVWNLCLSSFFFTTSRTYMRSMPGRIHYVVYEAKNPRHLHGLLRRECESDSWSQISAGDPSSRVEFNPGSLEILSYHECVACLSAYA